MDSGAWVEAVGKGSWVGLSHCLGKITGLACTGCWGQQRVPKGSLCVEASQA